MLTSCVNCKFIIERNDEYCFNCGINNPTEQLRLPKVISLLLEISGSHQFKISFGLLISAILIYVVSGANLENLSSLSIFDLIIGVVLGLILSYGGFALVRYFLLRSTRNKRTKIKRNLTSIDKVIESRLIELRAREHKLDLVLERLNGTKSEELRSARGKLLDVREAVYLQRIRYAINAARIEVARLQNSSLPILTYQQELNELEVESGLYSIENKMRHLEDIRDRISNICKDGNSESVRREIDEFFDQLAETGGSFEKLQNALLSRQAANALREFSPIENSLSDPTENEIMISVDAFNIRSTLTDFSNSFEELELEYSRLRAENEVEKSLNAGSI